MGDTAATCLGYPPAVAGAVAVSSAQRNEIHLGRAHEIVLRETADRVRGESHVAVVVADLEIRVVILDIRHVRERIDEAHGPIEVAEAELATEGEPILGERPAAGDLRQEPL